MTRFCTQNIPKMFGVQFLWFVVSTAEKYFCQMLAGFLIPKPTRVGKVENQAQITQFCTQKYPYYLGCNSYCFSSVRLKNVSVEF